MDHDSVPNVLADRYASPAMKAVWSTRGRVVLEREYWIAVMKAQRDLGLDIPAAALAAYEKVKGQVDFESIRKREEETRHDVKARIGAEIDAHAAAYAGFDAVSFSSATRAFSTCGGLLLRSSMAF